MKCVSTLKLTNDMMSSTKNSAATAAAAPTASAAMGAEAQAHAQAAQAVTPPLHQQGSGLGGASQAACCQCRAAAAARALAQRRQRGRPGPGGRACGWAPTCGARSRQDVLHAAPRGRGLALRVAAGDAADGRGWPARRGARNSPRRPALQLGRPCVPERTDRSEERRSGPSCKCHTRLTASPRGPMSRARGGTQQSHAANHVTPLAAPLAA